MDQKPVDIKETGKKSIQDYEFYGSRDMTYVVSIEPGLITIDSASATSAFACIWCTFPPIIPSRPNPCGWYPSLSAYSFSRNFLMARKS